LLKSIMHNGTKADPGLFGGPHRMLGLLNQSSMMMKMLDIYEDCPYICLV